MPRPRSNGARSMRSCPRASSRPRPRDCREPCQTAAAHDALHAYRIDPEAASHRRRGHRLRAGIGGHQRRRCRKKDDAMSETLQRVAVTLIVNGEPHTITVEPRTTPPRRLA